MEDRISDLATRIDALLPQTQCRRCGFDACRPYAEALARWETELNRCPPGGAALIAELAALLDRPPLPLDAACGTEGPARVAWIDEPACIGCELCVPACPVDCIHMVPAPGFTAEPLAPVQVAERALRDPGFGVVST